MNTANKLTISRIVMSIFIVIILLFPFYQFGIDIPMVLVNGNIFMDIRYLICGVIFAIASITDYFDGYIARKNKTITDFGKTFDAIADKLLTNPLLIILACNNMISPIIAIVFVTRDIITDALKLSMGSKIGAVGAIKLAKYKTAILMVGITLTLFYNLPFAVFNLQISDFILIIAAILSIISGIQYYNMYKNTITEK